jgi:hypothetical protein
MDLKALEKIWGQHELASGQQSHWSIGPLGLWAKTTDQELWLAHQQLEGRKQDELATGLSELEWSRWALKKSPVKISVLPVFPDRPVVVTPESPFRIVVGASARVYIRVPLWIRIARAQAEGLPFCEVPTMALSKTWFGEYAEGEHCYWISSSARREAVVDVEKRHLVICPVEITNKADEDLYIERICHRVGALSIYASKEQLWASESKVSFHGGREVSQINTGKGAPKEAKEGVLLSSARNPERSGFRAKTFRALQSLSGIGMKFVEEIT